MTGRRSWEAAPSRDLNRALAGLLLAGAAGAAIGAAVGSPALVIGAPVGVVGWWHHRRLMVASVGRGAATDRTIELVAQLIQHLKGGHSLAQALRATATAHAGPAWATGPDQLLARVRADADAGTGLEAALIRAAASPGSDPAEGLLVRALVVLVQQGGPALPALERLDDTLRSARWVEQETGAQASQATASALALAALPALFVGALAVLDRSLARFYAFHPLGAVCLVGAALLAYTGWWWMQRIVTASLRSPL